MTGMTKTSAADAVIETGTPRPHAHQRSSPRRTLPSWWRRYVVLQACRLVHAALRTITGCPPLRRMPLAYSPPTASKGVGYDMVANRELHNAGMHRDSGSWVVRHGRWRPF